MPLNVHFGEALEPDELAELRARLSPEVQITASPDDPAPASYHILVAGRPNAAQITASPNLHTVIVPWAGVPESTRQLMADYPQIAVHNLHYNAAPTAEMAMTLLLAAAKRLVPIDRALRRHDWTPRYQPSQSIQLDGKTALILGYGAIGQRVARACQALGMRVLATRRNPALAGPTDVAAEIHPSEDLRRLLLQSNALIITLPLTPDTHGLIGAAELALLPPQAILVNVGRGPIVDEAALYAALSSGALGAAGLDVWYNYPTDEASRRSTPPSRFPFHELDNVALSPHRAGDSMAITAHRMAHLAALLNAAARGERIPNRVDLQAGY